MKTQSEDMFEIKGDLQSMHNFKKKQKYQSKTVHHSTLPDL